METTHRTDLSLELSGADAPDGNVRQKVADICVSHFGLPSGDAERLFDRDGPFLVSTLKSGVDLNRITAELAGLGVLVRHSKIRQGKIRDSSVPSSSRRAALYSSQYGDLLSAQRQRKTPQYLSTESQSHARLRPKLLIVGILAALMLLGVPSSRYVIANFYSSSWSGDDFQPTSLGSGVLLSSDNRGLSATFRGSASFSGVQLACQVSRNGNTYSARFTGTTLDQNPPQARIEGEPTFLIAETNRHSATTTYTITEPSGTFRTGDARIEVLFDESRTPRQARITLELPRDLGRSNSHSTQQVTLAIDLLS